MQSETTSLSPGVDQPDSAAIIAVEGLSYCYPGAGRPALSDIRLLVPRGSCFGLLGPNGAGKTTLISLLTGMLPPQQDSIRVDRHSFVGGGVAIRDCSALVPQDYAFYPTLTGRENLQFFLGLYRVPRHEWAVRLAFCVDICGLQEVLDKRAETYSGGIKRRLNIAIGLLSNPQILYLDEPTVGIDAQSRHFILQGIQQLKSRGMTIVYTSHYMEEVEQICDHVAIIDHGRVLVQQAMAELLCGGGKLFVTPAAEPTPALCERLRAALGISWNGRQLVAEAGTHPHSSVLAALESAGVVAVGIQLGRHRLEDIYLSLTHHELRE